VNATNLLTAAVTRAPARRRTNTSTSVGALHSRLTSPAESDNESDALMTARVGTPVVEIDEDSVLECLDAGTPPRSAKPPRRSIARLNASRKQQRRSSSRSSSSHAVEPTAMGFPTTPGR